MMQTGQVTTSVLTKGDVTEVEKKEHPAIPSGMRTSMENILPFAIFFSRVSLLCISQHLSLFSCTMW